MTDLKVDDMAEMIKEKERELYELKKQYRERRTEGLRHALEQKKEAEKFQIPFLVFSRPQPIYHLGILASFYSCVLYLLF